jgi:hypothetical protein
VAGNRMERVGRVVGGNHLTRLCTGDENAVNCIHLGDSAGTYKSDSFEQLKQGSLAGESESKSIWSHAYT